MGDSHDYTNAVCVAASGAEVMRVAADRRPGKEDRPPFPGGLPAAMEDFKYWVDRMRREGVGF